MQEEVPELDAKTYSTLALSTNHTKPKLKKEVLFIYFSLKLGT